MLSPDRFPAKLLFQSVAHALPCDFLLEGLLAVSSSSLEDDDEEEEELLLDDDDELLDDEDEPDCSSFLAARSATT